MCTYHNRILSHTYKNLLSSLFLPPTELFNVRIFSLSRAVVSATAASGDGDGVNPAITTYLFSLFRH
jgi:hypothetical protein